jgi:mycothiol synthase
VVIDPTRQEVPGAGRTSAVVVREVGAAGGGVAEALSALRDAVDAEVNPHDPPNVPTAVAAEHFGRPADRPARTWLVWHGGEPAGWALAELSEGGPNAHLAEVELEVRPALRGLGLGRALVGAVATALLADGRTSVIGWCRDDRGSAFAERLGLTHRQDERCSRLVMDELDDAQQAGWLDAPKARAAGYRLVGWDESGCPEELVDAYRWALEGMDDAPLDGIEWTPEHLERHQLRDREAVRRNRGHLARTTLALAPDDSPAGITELRVHRDRLAVAEQGDTAVLPAHRGHGLGRWLKAENLRAARAAWPGLAVVETYNAETNPWMLDINVAMGFQPHVRYRAHQGPTAGVLAALDG